MHLRQLAEGDLEIVRGLRNRDRRWFFDEEEITPEQQRSWFASLANRPVRFFVIEEDSRVVGTISITETAEGSEIGNLLLEDDFRGRGLMTLAVQELTSKPGRYLAHVKANNERSLRVFEQAGFAASQITVERVVD